MNWQLDGTSLAPHWPTGQKRIGPMKEAIEGPMRRHSLAIHWPNQVMLSGSCYVNIGDIFHECSSRQFSQLAGDCETCSNLSRSGSTFEDESDTSV